MMRQAYEGERTFDTGGPEAQRAQLEALSRGFGDDPEENQRIMAENYEGDMPLQPQQPKGGLESLSDADLDAILAGDLDSVSDAGLDVLLALPQNEFDNLFPAQPEESPAQAVTPGEGGDDISRFLVEGVGGIENAMPPEAEQPEIKYTPGQKLAAGMSFEAGQLGRGLSQLYYQAAGTKEEVQAIQMMEQKARDEYAKIDEQGFGPEDIGEAVLSFGTLLIPGANGVRAAAAGAKVFQGLSKLSGTLGTAGANAAIIGATEAAKATVEGESRLQKGATSAVVGAGSAYGLDKVGRIGKSVFTEGFIGKTLAAVGLGKATGATKSAVRDGLYRKFVNKFWPRKYSPVDPALSAKKLPTSPQSQSMRAAAMKAEVREAERTAMAPQVFQAFEDIIKGPKSPKTGRRSGGFVSVRANKWAKENGFDSTAEAQAVGSFLLSKSIIRGQRGEILFDRAGVLEGYNYVSKQDNFNKAFGKTKAGKQLEAFMAELRTGQGPISFEAILDKYEYRNAAAAAQTLANLTEPAQQQLQRKLAGIKARTVAAVTAEAQAQGAVSGGSMWDSLLQFQESIAEAYAELGE